MAKIILQDVEVHYPAYGDQHHSLRRTLINLTTGGRIFKDERKISFIKALDKVTFTLEKGDRLGLIGSNGSGKTTLLKTLGRLYVPAAGSLFIEGHISALFDVCMGMDVERTGYHNIYYMSALLGFPKAKIKSIIADIEEFSELGDFLDMPVRTYSAGMKVRLGFALCTCLEPAILLLDEAIGAGDQHFLEKAAKRAKALYDKAEILVLASHANGVIREFCNKVLWLHKGRMIMFGPVAEVLHQYETNSGWADQVIQEA